jgi:hypothetical protein
MTKTPSQTNVGEIIKGVWHEIAVRDSRRNGATWREHDDAVMTIEQARLSYDAGILTMAQRRDDTSFRLCVLMHVYRDHGRKPWFKRIESEHDGRPDSYDKRVTRTTAIDRMRAATSPESLADQARSMARSMDAARLQVLVTALGI